MKIVLRTQPWLILWAGLVVSGCTHLGPQTIPRDRFDYNAAISNSWKEQTLLNIVKIRYADMPLFVEVASVVSGYSFEGSVNLGATISTENTAQGDFFSLGSAGKYTDRPTITYAPITGKQFNTNFMTPIPPRAVLFLMQSGWSAELIFPVIVDSINGLRSRVLAGANQRSGDSDYYRVVKLLNKIQKSGAIGMQIEKAGEGMETTVLFFHRDMIDQGTRKTLKEAEELLGLRGGLQKMKVSYGLLPASDAHIAMLTRSMLQILIDLAGQIDTPPEDVVEGRTIPSRIQTNAGGEPHKRILDVRCSKEKPENAFTSVRYRDRWFWIDDRDFKSKRTFAFLMILFSLTETGGREGLPLVTIPAG